MKYIGVLMVGVDVMVKVLNQVEEMEKENESRWFREVCTNV